MSWGVVIAVALALAALSLVRWLRVFVSGFVLASVVLLALHAQSQPAEAALAMGALGGGLALARPLRRMMTGGWL